MSPPRLLDSCRPGRHARRQWYSTRRAARLSVSRPVAQTESDSSDIRGGWGVARLVRLVRLCRALSDEDVTGGATRQTRRRSKVPPTRRLVDSSCFFLIWGSPCDRIRAAYLLGKFDESDAAPFKCVSGRRLSDDPERYAPAKCAPDHPTSGSRRSSKKRGCNPSISRKAELPPSVDGVHG